jgi:hemoglobin-like flavoprotein
MTVPGAPPARHVEMAHESYRRCQRDEFFQGFYKRLLASHHSIPPMFASTDFTRQNKLLQHGLGLLLNYARRPNPALLERLAVRHARADLNVEPTLYPNFVDSLVATVREFDPECDPQVEQAWRAALAPGIGFMTSLYDGPPRRAEP